MSLLQKGVPFAKGILFDRTLPGLQQQPFSSAENSPLSPSPTAVSPACLPITSLRPERRVRNKNKAKIESRWKIYRCFLKWWVGKPPIFKHFLAGKTHGFGGNPPFLGNYNIHSRNYKIPKMVQNGITPPALFEKPCLVYLVVKSRGCSLEGRSPYSHQTGKGTSTSSSKVPSDLIS